MCNWNQYTTLQLRMVNEIKLPVNKHAAYISWELSLIKSMRKCTIPSGK